MKKTNCKILKEWADEEHQASKMYKQYGFNKIANDEAKHSKKFKEILKKCKR